MLFYGKTDVGMKRAVNQDNFIIKKYSPDVLFAVVCDGMGGANGGNVASSLAVDTFAARVDEYEKKHREFFGLNEEDILDLLSDAVTEANRVVYRQALSDISLFGMGTTLVGCIVSGERVYVVNVGDSRLYVSTQNDIVQVTHDHSYVQYFIDQGKMTAEEARKSRNKNLITRAVGIEKTVGADLFSHDLTTGSCALLCSDGLTNLITPEEIHDIIGQIASSEDIEKVCGELIDEANRRGGNDNITAVLLSV